MTFAVEKDNRCVVEVTIRGGGTIFRAQEETKDGDIRSIIDAACATIDRQIRKNRTRLSKRLRQDALVPDMPAEFDIKEEREFEVVRTKHIAVKPMTEEEAILQMNLLGHSFFAFKNEDAGGAFAVVYRRNDGDYGIIEDET